MAQAGEQVTGTRDESYDLLSVLYHCLQAATTCEQYIRDAEQAGEHDLAEFFRDYQETQKALAERAKNLLGARLGRPLGVRAGRGGTARVEARVPPQRRSPGAQTNAQVNSGGRGELTDIVDEQSKESFPASDAPAH
ncbi:MAG TPA: hypothetical protein VLQ93_23045 [Myxococcaceae bacterium]|nr:hypothetical protein [Myxococcaceae bacterium]